MSYIATLHPQQLSNMDIILKTLREYGITNHYTQAACLAVVSKECEFTLHSEQGYAHTPNERIRELFGHHFDGVTDQQMDNIKADNHIFFNRVYGNMYGNTSTNAWMYVGRGFNQITFYANYKSLGDKLHLDLVNHPELLDNPINAAKTLVQYFIDRFHSITVQAQAEDHNKGTINDFTNTVDALMGMYHANAGWGKAIFPDTTGGYAKARSRVDEFYNYVTTHNS